MTQVQTTARYPDGVGIGIERSRCYLAHDVASGSARSVERIVADYVDQPDVCRIWLKNAKKKVIWEHQGPLASAPDFSDLLTVHVEDVVELEDPSGDAETIATAA